MLEIRKSAVAFDEQEMMRLEGIILDNDAIAALVFLRNSVYNKIINSQRGKLHSHLDTTSDTTPNFKQGQPK